VCERALEHVDRCTLLPPTACTRRPQLTAAPSPASIPAWRFSLAPVPVSRSTRAPIISTANSSTRSGAQLEPHHAPAQTSRPANSSLGVPHRGQAAAARLRAYSPPSEATPGPFKRATRHRGSSSSRHPSSERASRSNHGSRARAAPHHRGVSRLSRSCLLLLVLPAPPTALANTLYGRCRSAAGCH
jgi:hypothetical protein